MIQYGQPQYAETNAMLNAALTRCRPLIMVHRGTHAGLVVQNTDAAVRAAVTSGADIIEIDLARSTDGEFYVFHDGYELDLLGHRANLTTLPAAQIDAMPYYRSHGVTKPAHVERAAALFETHRGRTLFNVDRSWFWWPELFGLLDQLDIAGQIVLKCNAVDDLVAHLVAHPVKYPFTPMVFTMEEALRYVGEPELNLVGLELIAHGPDSPFLDPANLAELRSHGLHLMANAEVIKQDTALFNRYDDEVAIFDNPDAGWGPLFDLDMDIIQTDWPWLLRDYRSVRAERAAQADQGAQDSAAEAR
ncbi:MAG: glycerophosphodiester phosphodiesterase family protein [Dermatophilus congolensis]|nr:glycerophosphodiester phosphodiesterase family protein [Dermatophilus congolensis]